MVLNLKTEMVTSSNCVTLERNEKVLNSSLVYTVPNCNIIYLYYPEIKEKDEKKDKHFVIVQR